MLNAVGKRRRRGGTGTPCSAAAAPAPFQSPAPACYATASLGNRFPLPVSLTRSFTASGTRRQPTPPRPATDWRRILATERRRGRAMSAVSALRDGARSSRSLPWTSCAPRSTASMPAPASSIWRSASPARRRRSRCSRRPGTALADGRFGYTEALGIRRLRARIARHYGESHGIDVSPERIAVTTGSSAGFNLGFLAAFDAGDRIALAAPGYPAYRNILGGARPRGGRHRDDGDRAPCDHARDARRGACAGAARRHSGRKPGQSERHDDAPAKRSPR